MARPRTAKPRTPDIQAFGKAAELTMKRKGMTLESVADAGGLDPKQVGSYFRGVGNPTLISMTKLCKGLGVSVAELALRAGALRQLDDDAADQAPPVPMNPRVVWMPGGVRTEIHLSAQDTGGAFCMLVDYPPAGWSLPPHVHNNEAETIHVLKGRFEIEVARQHSHLDRGQTVHVPQGVVHATANSGRSTGQRLLLFSPAGMERFFLEAGVSKEGAEIDVSATRACAIQHGWEFVEET